MNRVGVIGWPIAHSLSPAMHNAAFRALGMDGEWLYDAMAIPPDIADHGFKQPKLHGYIGINVTIPFKQIALEQAVPDEKARAIGAANTIDFRDDTATNTDVDGFMEDLAANEIAVRGQRVIVLGAGGAARAAVYGLWQGGAEVIVVNRTLERAQDMLFQLTISAGVRTVKALPLEEAALDGADLVVNATSAGMKPNVDSTPWPVEVPFLNGVTVYDMVYTPSSTRFMQQAEAAGGRAIGGLGMLVRQGAKAFEIWTGMQAPIDVMMETVRNELAQRKA